MTNSAIEADSLDKFYRDKRGRKIGALRSLSLKIHCGEIFGFLGPNGAGKSTTIRLLMGLIRPSNGCAKILGVDCRDARARRSVGYLPENPAFFDYLTAFEYLAFVSQTFGLSRNQIKENRDRVLELVDLTAAAKRPIRSYSKGMVQRLGLAQALVHDPDILIMDEPMSGLDPVGRALVKQIIQDLKEQGKTVFFSSHITSDVESICDRVAILKKGELQRVDEVGELLIKGVSGYRVHFRKHNGMIEEAFIKKNSLSQSLVSAEKEGQEVVLVEPCRKSLEQLFLDTIKATE